MKKLITVLIICLACFVFASCDDAEQREGKATVFGVTDRCPVRVDMTVDGDGKVNEMKIYEYLSVYEIGKLDIKGEKFGSPVPAENGYAKFVRVGENRFEYVEGEYRGYDEYIAQNGDEYIRCMTEGDFDLLDENGNDLALPFDVYDGHKLKKTEWADKMKNGYREGNEYAVGWKEDMYALITHIRNHGFYDYRGDEKAGKSGTFKVGKYDTLVSQANFHDYMRIAKRAYDAACRNLE